MSGMIHYLRGYFHDVRDAGWQFSDLVWASICGGLLMVFVVYVICWWMGACQ